MHGLLLSHTWLSCLISVSCGNFFLAHHPMNFYNLFFSELEISASRSGFARDEKEKNKSTREIIRRMSAGKEKEKKNPNST